MNTIKNLLLRVTIILSFIGLGCSSCHISNREVRLMNEGKEIIKKIEDYKKKHNKLPGSLSDMGIEEQDGMDVLYYYKRDSINYTVSFPISAEKHKFYYSDSKKWEEGYRDMK
jgi:hypothetical protein